MTSSRDFCEQIVRIGSQLDVIEGARENGAERAVESQSQTPGPERTQPREVAFFRKRTQRTGRRESAQSSNPGDPTLVGWCGSPKSGRTCRFVGPDERRHFAALRFLIR